MPSYDEASLCGAAFIILKKMVSTWLREVSQFKNPFADYLLMHFYRYFKIKSYCSRNFLWMILHTVSTFRRWLRSPTSFMYDPALRRILHNYSKKLFVQLVAEMQRLGLTIVYADFTKIILNTKKTNPEDAYAYTDFITQKIMQKELFHSIHFEPENCWKYLIWLDLVNHNFSCSYLYGGILNMNFELNE